MSFDIYIPRFSYIQQENPVITGKMGIAGEFKLVLRDLMGNPVYESPWQKNLITDKCLDLLARDYIIQNYPTVTSTNSHATLLALGSGNTAPAFTDLVLANEIGVATTSTNESYSAFYNTGAPDYALYRVYEYRFNAGVATGTIAELGMRMHADTPLSTRALVTPTVTKTADQVLDVFYRIYWYPDLTDTTGTITLDGEVFDYVNRGCNLDSGQGEFKFGYVTINQGLSGYYGGGECDLATEFGDITVYATMNPSAPASGIGSNSFNDALASYTPGSHYLDFEYIMSINQMTYPEGAGNLQALYMAGFNFMHKTHFTSQTDAVTTGIPKDDTNELRLWYRFNWGRR